MMPHDSDSVTVSAIFFVFSHASSAFGLLSNKLLEPIDGKMKMSNIGNMSAIQNIFLIGLRLMNISGCQE